MDWIVIFFIVLEIVVLPAVPLIVYRGVFYKNLKLKKAKLSIVLLILFIIIALIPVTAIAVPLIGYSVGEYQEYTEMKSAKKELIQYVCENKEDYYRIAEYESSFTYPENKGVFQEGHSEEHLQEQLGIKLEHPYRLRLIIDSDSGEVDCVEWYYITEGYEIYFVYPNDYTLHESYELICDNIYVKVFENDH